MPHAFIGYAGSTLRAAEMYREVFPDEGLTVLIDYFGQEITDALAVCQAFPELGRAEVLITEALKAEETRFKQTLGRGLRLLEEETDKLAAGAPLAGDVAFKLYDTFGFPLDLTEDVLRGQGRVVETTGFDTAMKRQRADARKSWKGSGETASEEIWFDIRDRAGVTEFLGYSTLVADAQIVAVVMDGAESESAETGATLAVVTNQTPFYGESGGQVGDTGVMFSAGGAEIAITDTRKELGDLHVHLGEVTRGRIAPGDILELRVDGARRDDLRAHHSATHLLHEALLQLLGDHVTQKGSMVASDRLRFDISHPTAISADNLRTLERAVNSRIRANLEVTTRLMTPDEAIEGGAMALFGEKYGDEVRVVSMGRDDDRYSVELCGGTHVGRTGDIGAFKIITEGALASGVRRIEALAGAAADDYFAAQESLLRQSAAQFKAAPQDVPGRISALLEERKRLERELADTRRKLATGAAANGAGDDAAKEIAGVKFAGRKVDGVPAKELKPMADDLKKQIGSGIVAIIAVDDGKASLVVGVTDELTDRCDAVKLVRAGSAALGGKGGGGRPDMAQAGGPDGGAAESALQTIEGAIADQA